jgi:hypothetical protein
MTGLTGGETKLFAQLVKKATRDRFLSFNPGGADGRRTSRTMSAAILLAGCSQRSHQLLSHNRVANHVWPFNNTIGLCT